MIYILNNRLGKGSFLPFQSATDDMLAQSNPAYITQEDIHTYDYIPADDEILTEADQCPLEIPPEVPPDRKVQQQDLRYASKG